MDSAALLKAQGWRGHGHSLDDKDRGLAKPILVSKRAPSAGLGTKSNADFGHQWWLDAFDQKLKNFGTDSDSNNQIVEGQLQTEKSDGNFPTKRAQAGQSNSANNKAAGKRSALYNKFVRAEPLSGTIDTPRTESLSEDLQTSIAVPPSNFKTAATPVNMSGTLHSRSEGKKRKRPPSEEEQAEVDRRSLLLKTFGYSYAPQEIVALGHNVDALFASLSPKQQARASANAAGFQTTNLAHNRSGSSQARSDTEQDNGDEPPAEAMDSDLASALATALPTLATITTSEDNTRGASKRKKQRLKPADSSAAANVAHGDSIQASEIRAMQQDWIAMRNEWVEMRQELAAVKSIVAELQSQRPAPGPSLAEQSYAAEKAITGGPMSRSLPTAALASGDALGQVRTEPKPKSRKGKKSRPMATSGEPNPAEQADIASMANVAALPPQAQRVNPPNVGWGSWVFSSAGSDGDGGVGSSA